MWMAIEAVKKGDADVIVSAGNTGALMAMAKICLKTISRIERPALACLWPTLRGQSVVLDVGATMGANARHLVDLAIMGSAMASIILGLDRPSVGLLNVGTEEIKGVEEVKKASQILKDSNLPSLRYAGFVEGDGIGLGAADVVVTEGFTGNITLKTAEGTAKQISSYLKEAMSSSLLSKLGYFLARGAFNQLRARMDTRAINGGVFLGVEGVVIKSHGGMDAIGFARAIEIGYEMARSDLLNRIRKTVELAHLFQQERSTETPAQKAPL
jgi:glycerol-3-phosphate acyltransferase PlsX